MLSNFVKRCKEFSVDEDSGLNQKAAGFIKHGRTPIAEYLLLERFVLSLTDLLWTKVQINGHVRSMGKAKLVRQDLQACLWCCVNQLPRGEKLTCMQEASGAFVSLAAFAMCY